MFKYLTLLLLLVFSRVECKEKKVIIFTCASGGGHIAAAKAISEILKDCRVLTYAPQDDLFPYMSKSYTYHLSNGNYGILNSMYYLKEVMLPLFFLVTEPSIFTYMNVILEKERPDLLISVVPYGNQVMLDIANKHKIPFLIVTTDNDIRHWIYGLKYKDLSTLQITISRDLPFTKTLLIENKFELSQIKTVGLAVRPDFYEVKDKKKLCAESDIPFEKPKILIMFGAQGGTKMNEYIEKINQFEKEVHMIAACGQNEELVKKLNEISLQNGNSLTALPFTKRISDYMSLSDLIITKSGACTIEEALVLQRPILIDGTQNLCIWEKANADVVISYKVGAIVDDVENLPSLFKTFLRDNRSIEEAYKKVPKNNFPESIKNIVNALIKNDKT